MDAEYFHQLQTQTGWSRTLVGFAAWCSPQPGWRILDVGCGPGLLPALFTKLGCSAVGVDLDESMFKPSPLHPSVVVADAKHLPFTRNFFDLITASNLLFFLPEPLDLLIRLKKLLRPAGKIAMLNPSELLTPVSAAAFADDQGLEGIARSTLINWADRASANHRWTDAETRLLYSNAGLQYQESVLKVGPGFGRFSSATA